MRNLLPLVTLVSCVPEEDRFDFKPYREVIELNETRPASRGHTKPISAKGEIALREIEAATFCRERAPIFRKEDLRIDVDNFGYKISEVIHEEGCEARVKLECPDDGILESTIEADCSRRQ